MADFQQYIAVDRGAESGRVMLGSVSTERLILKEIHRFTNAPIDQADTLRWNFKNLFSQIKTGISKAAKQATHPIAGIAVDSWGVDFGLLDEAGNLIENPYNYRDSRTDGMMDKAFETIPKRAIYNATGLQFMQLNTIYQLLAMRQANSDTLAKAKTLLFTADLYAYHLCGQPFAEYTLASTSQLMDMATGKWSTEIFDKLNLPIDIMPSIVQPGTIVGELTEKIAAELGCEPIPVIAIGSHDTASAVAAVPAGEGNWAYLSSGTWSLIGLEVPKAIINDQTFDFQLTNEGGVDNTIRLLKNIMGLWLVQECKKQWQADGCELSYSQITEMAQKAKPFAAHIDPDHEDFLAPGDMPKRINDYLAQTHQQQIEDKGQMIRAILESLALKYREVIEKLEDISGKKLDCLNIVGGGIQNQLLCEFTANAIGKKVITGPIEATASGNILTQAMATGQIESLDQIRKIVANSFDLTEYKAQDVDLWQKQYDKVKG